MIIPLVLTAVFALLAYLLFKHCKGSKIKPLNIGDVAYLKSAYLPRYPRIPHNLPVRVEALKGEKAVVVFIQPSVNDAVREEIEIKALKQPL